APGLPWPAAIALGAIVAPPDAAAATAVLKQMRPPHRLLVILEGESPFNDASALLVYRLAVVAAVAGTFSPWSALPLLAVVSLGSVLAGAVLSRLLLFVIGRVRDVATSVIIQFVTTFAVWILAERLRLSGIITIVTFAILTARSSPASMPARLRIPSYAVWEVAVFVLNVLAFILVGLQLRPILQRLDRPQLLDYLATAAAVCAVVIVVRMVWALAYALAERWPRRHPAHPRGNGARGSRGTASHGKKRDDRAPCPQVRGATAPRRPIDASRSGRGGRRACVRGRVAPRVRGGAAQVDRAARERRHRR